MTIPKIVHQIWIGQNARPNIWMDTVRKFCADFGYEYKLWTEIEISKFNIINISEYNTVELLSGKADILRYELLYAYGGVYIDADSVIINPKNFDILISDTTVEFLAGHAEISDGRILNGTMFSIPKSLIMKKCIYNISMTDFIGIYNHGEIVNLTGPTLLTKVCNTYKDICDIKILDSNIFYPYGFWGNKDIKIHESLEFKEESVIFQYGYSTNDLCDILNNYSIETSKKIGIIIPTRSRPHNIKRLYATWFEMLDLEVSTDCIIVLDKDDENKYERLEGFRYIIVENNTRGVNYPLNCAARHIYSEYEYIGFLGDDHIPRTKEWNSIMYNKLKSIGPYGMVYGNDLLQGSKLATAIIMDSLFVKTLGYMAHPDFKHLFIDDFWMYIGNYLKTLKYVDNVIIEHLHYSVGKSSVDELYESVNTREINIHGNEVYNRITGSVEFNKKLDSIKKGLNSNIVTALTNKSTIKWLRYA